MKKKSAQRERQGLKTSKRHSIAHAVEQENIEVNDTPDKEDTLKILTVTGRLHGYCVSPLLEVQSEHMEFDTGAAVSLGSQSTKRH